MSDKIKPQHLARKAIVYVRQSSAHQVHHNLESQRLQYAMQDRLQQLGWREIDVVDDDLGRSAAGLVTRAGFEKDPDRRIQEAIGLVFRKCVELGTVRQTLWWFLEHGLQLPVRTASSEITWRRPSYGMLYRILSSPVYGGAYAYGKSERTVHYEQGEPRVIARRKRREQWLVLIPNAHEGYVSWEEFERIQQMMAANVRGRGRVGAATRGPALLAGLLRCRRCGRRLTVWYTGATHDVLRYACHRGALDNGDPRCISFGGLVVDAAMAKEVLRVVQPAAIDAAVVANEDASRQQDDVLQAWTRELEAARYAAQRAQKQYDAADPENRLVADELERRWNHALQRVHEIEGRIDQHRHNHHDVATPTREEFAGLAADLKAVWHGPHADVRVKKRLVRTVIHGVVVDVDNHFVDHGADQALLHPYIRVRTMPHGLEVGCTPCELLPRRRRHVMLHWPVLYH